MTKISFNGNLKNEIINLQLLRFWNWMVVQEIRFWTKLLIHKSRLDYLYSVESLTFAFSAFLRIYEAVREHFLENCPCREGCVIDRERFSSLTGDPNCLLKPTPYAWEDNCFTWWFSPKSCRCLKKESFHLKGVLTQTVVTSGNDCSGWYLRQVVILTGQNSLT